MVERRTGPTPAPSCRHAVGRIPDGQGVPLPPRPAPAGMSRSEWLRVFGAVVVVIALALLIRALR